MSFGGALNFDKPARLVHHDVHIGFSVAVFVVVEVEHRLARANPDRYRRHRAVNRAFLQHRAFDQAVRGVVQSNKGTADCGGARTAVGLQHVTVDHDGAFTKCFQIHHRPQRTPDQALDLDNPPLLTASDRLARHTGVRGTRQHPVLGGYPPFPAALQESRRTFIDARGAKHSGAPELGQNRSFGVSGVGAGETDRPQLVVGSIACSHQLEVVTSQSASDARHYTEADKVSGL